MVRVKGPRSRMDRRQQILWSYAAIIGRGAILGGAVFLLLTDDPNYNLQLNIISYAIALLWAYYNGTFARGRGQHVVARGVHQGAELGLLLA
jgi:hypothetical protein